MFDSIQDKKYVGLIITDREKGGLTSQQTQDVVDGNRASTTVTSTHHK